MWRKSFQVRDFFVLKLSKRSICLFLNKMTSMSMSTRVFDVGSVTASLKRRQISDKFPVVKSLERFRGVIGAATVVRQQQPTDLLMLFSAKKKLGALLSSVMAAELILAPKRMNSASVVLKWWSISLRYWRFSVHVQLRAGLSLLTTLLIEISFGH